MVGNDSTRHDFSEQSPVHAVVTTIANIEDTGVVDLEPLAHAIDTDRLDALVSPSENCSIDGRMAFRYCGYRVVVHANGEVAVDAEHD